MKRVSVKKTQLVNRSPVHPGDISNQDSPDTLARSEIYDDWANLDNFSRAECIEILSRIEAKDDGFIAGLFELTNEELGLRDDVERAIMRQSAEAHQALGGSSGFRRSWRRALLREVGKSRDEAAAPPNNLGYWNTVVEHPGWRNGHWDPNRAYLAVQKILENRDYIGLWELGYYKGHGMRAVEAPRDRVLAWHFRGLVWNEPLGPREESIASMSGCDVFNKKVSDTRHLFLSLSTMMQLPWRRLTYRAQPPALTQKTPLSSRWRYPLWYELSQEPFSDLVQSGGQGKAIEDAVWRGLG